jgi:thiol-disulfide isomerase/thioredoxin
MDSHNQLVIRKMISVIIATCFMCFGIPVAQAKSTQAELQNALSTPYAAPAIDGIDSWINSQPLTLMQLKGKVVLVDFWTYSCINCYRTIPYLKNWYQKYHDKGFEIIAVHSPEFDFEKNETNVKNAIAKYGIQYPVALDNQYVTWDHFQNKFWPALYLIDQEGQVVYQHVGEGDYEITENNIHKLLNLKESPSTIKNPDKEMKSRTQETYLGFARTIHFASPQKIVKERTAQYTQPDDLLLNHWALRGAWIMDAEKIISAQANATLSFHFKAKKIFVVMGTVANKSIQAKILLNGKLVSSENGKDVAKGLVDIKEHRMYEIVSLDQNTSGILQIVPASSGLEVYVFTFGG